ncbi:MAG: UxaA family hydrolase [Thaumarchaeota archaeon]|nr:UxaA family hydrolase [Nitrososphaerota archaeon]
MDNSFDGFLRTDGLVGVRNNVAVIYTVDCARIVSDRIAQSIPNGTSVGWYSCYSTEDGKDVETLSGIGSNPNIGAAIIVGLGCQSISPSLIGNKISNSGKRAEVLSIQGVGGTNKTIGKGIEIAKQMSKELLKQKRAKSDLSKLSVGVMLDPAGFSSTRRIVRSVSNTVTSTGGKILLGQAARKFYGNDSFPTLEPGNIPDHSGWYNVEGLVARSTRYFGLEGDAEPTDLAAMGAQILLREVLDGFVGGNVVSPVVKLCGDAKISRTISRDLDFGSSSGGTKVPEKEARRVVALILEIASGRKTASEISGNLEGGLILGGRPLLTVPARICE